MRVVNSSRLWDNRLIKGGRQKPAHTLPQAILFSAFLVIGLLIIMPSSAQPAPHIRSAPLAQTPAIGPVRPETGHVAGQSTELEPVLLPESDNPSTFLVKKILSIPPPLPAPNCLVDACVALTFDDGPNPDSSSLIVNALKAAQAKATFFEIGRNVVGHETYLQQMHAAGDEIGDHSWSHPSFVKLTPTDIDAQINQAQAAITAAGVPAPTLFRPPYGDINQQVAARIHLAIILWNVDPKDWAQKDPGSIAKNVEQQIKPGAIIVMHDKKLTAEALPQILKDLKGRFRFVTVSQLLNLSPSAQGVYIGR